MDIDNLLNRAFLYSFICFSTYLITKIENPLNNAKVENPLNNCSDVCGMIACITLVKLSAAVRRRHADLGGYVHRILKEATRGPFKFPF